MNSVFLVKMCERGCIVRHSAVHCRTHHDCIIWFLYVWLYLKEKSFKTLQQVLCYKVWMITNYWKVPVNSWGLRMPTLLTAHSCFLCNNSMFVFFSCNLQLTLLFLSLLTNDACVLCYLNNQNTLDSVFFGFHQRCKWNKPPSTCGATNSESFFQSSDTSSFSADSDN